ncbi:hypothetical protein BDV3_005993 [Batrachochytrium dendrobatidis]|nr:Poly(A) polymerase [Batrachochytrium dendrobatidis]KAK5666732.1 Poly(A) polymerase [Batrachochytrium dendrobatidis]
MAETETETASAIDLVRNNIVTAIPDLPIHNELDLNSNPKTFNDQLTQDMIDLAIMLAPLPPECSLRTIIIDLIINVCDDIWPDSSKASVSVFGSSAIGIYLSDSDIDIAVSVPQTDRSLILYKLYAQLKHQTWISEQSLQFISTAKIPLIKFSSIPQLGKIRIDIVANTDSGNESTELMKTWVGKYPTLIPMALVLKLLIRQHRLDKVFTGGLGGYALLNMIVAVLIRDQHCSDEIDARAKENAKNNTDTQPHLDPGVSRLSSAPLHSVQSLGRLIWQFFELFGRTFDYTTNAIRISDNLSYSPITVESDSLFIYPRYHRVRDDSYGLLENDRIRLRIYDPTNASNNISRGSYRTQDLHQLFSQSLDTLVTYRDEFDKHGLSGLSDIVKPNMEMEIERDKTLKYAIDLMQCREKMEIERNGDVPAYQVLERWLGKSLGCGPPPSKIDQQQKRRNSLDRVQRKSSSKRQEPLSQKQKEKRKLRKQQEKKQMQLLEENQKALSEMMRQSEQSLVSQVKTQSQSNPQQQIPRTNDEQRLMTGRKRERERG